jgi:PASTA domain
VVCEAYSREEVFPDPQLPGGTGLPDSDQLVVPDLAGLSLDEAAAQLQSLGLTVAGTHTASDEVAEGLVVSQDPVPGTFVDPGTTVTIVVSAGPEAFHDVLRVTCPASGPPIVEQAVVGAQPDGLHILVDSRSDADAVLIRQPSRPWIQWSSGSSHLDDEFVRPVPPGETLIWCYTEPLQEPEDTHTGPQRADEASFRVADSAGWVSTDLSCPFDKAQPFEANPTLGSVSNGGDLAAAAVRMVPGVLPSDTVDSGGYPESTSVLEIRVIRDGAIVAVADARGWGEGAWDIHGFACPGSSIG